jgi:hypothetical protein
LDGYATGTAGAGEKGGNEDHPVVNNNLELTKLSKIDMCTPEKL